jgi:hypothetical protein
MINIFRPYSVGMTTHVEGLHVLCNSFIHLLKKYSLSNQMLITTLTQHISLSLKAKFSIAHLIQRDQSAVMNTSNLIREMQSVLENLRESNPHYVPDMPISSLGILSIEANPINQVNIYSNIFQSLMYDDDRNCVRYGNYYSASMRYPHDYRNTSLTWKIRFQLIYPT